MSLPTALAGIVVLLASIAGCLSHPDRSDVPTPFVLRSLNLREQDSEGRPAWQVTSPEARYDINRRLATAVRPVGVIYAVGKPLYQLTAERAMVVNDGEVIQLEGAVSIRRLGDRPVQVQAERLRWYPARSWIDIEHQPSLREGLSRVRAGQASINLRTEVVQLRQNPVFERWSTAAPSSTAPAPTPASTASPPLSLQASQAEWSLRSGDWRALGPIRGERRLPGTGAGQTVSASSMRGSSRDQNLELLAPVLLIDPAQTTRIEAQRTHIDLVSQRIASELPVRATAATLVVQGSGFTVDLKQNQALIPAGCQVRQPGWELQAGQCRWNWISRQIQAENDV
ncbi:MAG: LPS export ABC transporter periplasmic protein LptC, partial [Cyanobacteriota bacterium]